jgi:alpha-D-xyloside xylohydrolase
MELRESIRPYVEHHLLITSQTGTPIVTPMFFHYPDTACYAAQDQFAFGTEYVVAPVYVYQATSRDVYLPVLATGEVWVHVYTGQTYVGGKHYTIATTLADFPLFQRQTTTGKPTMTQTE